MFSHIYSHEDYRLFASANFMSVSPKSLMYLGLRLKRTFFWPPLSFAISTYSFSYFSLVARLIVRNQPPPIFISAKPSSIMISDFVSDLVSFSSKYSHPVNHIIHFISMPYAVVLIRCAVQLPQEHLLCPDIQAFQYQKSL